MATTVHHLPDLPTIPQFPGDDPTADLAAATAGWFTPAQLGTICDWYPDFAPVAAILGMDAIWEASRPWPA